MRDLRTGELLEQPAEKVTSVDWAADNKTLFYTTTDAAKRPYRLYRHAIGADGGGTLLYEEKDERFSVGVGRSRSKAFLFLEIGSLTTSEVHYLAAGQPAGTWHIVAPRKDNHEYDVDHRGDQFFIRTNQGGRNFALAVAPVSDPSPAQWKTIVPHRADVMLQSALVFEGQTVLFERANGLPRFRVATAGAEATEAWTALPFSEPAYTVSPASNPEFKTPTFRYAYQSFTTPQSVFDYDFATGKSTLLKETEVLGGYDRTKYATERVMATAPDGTKVPVSLVYLKTLVKNGSNPIYLTAYGSYGISSNVTFSSNRFSLIDRGVVYARRPHPRRRRPRQALARPGPHAAEEEHLHRLHRRSRVPDRAEVRGRAQPGDRGRQRRRAADGRGGQHAAGSVPRGRRAGAVRRRHQHDDRHDAAAHRRRVRGVGQPGRQSRRVRATSRATTRTATSPRRPTRRCW